MIQMEVFSWYQKGMIADSNSNKVGTLNYSTNVFIFYFCKSLLIYVLYIMVTHLNIIFLKKLITTLIFFIF